MVSYSKRLSVMRAYFVVSLEIATSDDRDSVGENMFNKYEIYTRHLESFKFKQQDVF